MLQNLVVHINSGDPSLLGKKNNAQLFQDEGFGKPFIIVWKHFIPPGDEGSRLAPVNYPYLLNHLDSNEAFCTLLSTYGFDGLRSRLPKCRE